MAKTPVNSHLRCGNCKTWFDYPKGRMPDSCPICGRQITSMTCNRCGHSWELRKRRFPATCPKCKSPYYATLKFKFRGMKDE